MSDISYNVTTKKPVMVGTSAFTALDPFDGANNISTTDATDTGYASTSFGDNSYIYAFDNNDNTYTGTGSTLPAWIKQSWPVARVINKYRIKGGGIAANNPTAWKFQGSQNDSDWTDLDTRSTTIPTSDWSSYYTFSCGTAYLYHRILVSADGGAGQSPRITEIEMVVSLGLTAAMCDGFNIISNTGATGTTTYALPAAANGLKITFIRTESYDLEIYPSGADTVVVNGTSYNSVKLTANNSIMTLTGKSGGWAADSVGSYADTYQFQGSTYGFATGGMNPYGTYHATIDKYAFASNTTAASHGNLTGGRRQPSSCSSTTQGFTPGGYNGVAMSSIDKFNFSSNVTATSHGNLMYADMGESGGHSSQTAGFVSGHGYNNTSVIEKFLFSSNTTASSHGNLTKKRDGAANCTYSGVAGFAGGEWNLTSDIDKFNFASNTTAANHGNLTRAQGAGSGHSSPTQGFSSAYYASGAYQNAIDKFDFASNTTATSHGNLSVMNNSGSAASGTMAGFTAAGYNGSNPITNVDKFNFASNTTSTGHGNLSSARWTISGGCQV